MIFHMLRMGADLGFYGAVAGFLSAQFAGTGALAGLLIQCLCYGLSSLGNHNRLIRFLLLSPMPLCWFLYTDNPADMIFLLPSALYICYLVWTNNYVLEHYRQKHLFGIYWRILLGLTVVLFFTGQRNLITAILIPHGSVMLMSSLLLMRSLRHDPEVYSQKTYQLVNFSAVFLLLLTAYLFSTSPFQKKYLYILNLLYCKLLQPILELAVSLFMLLLNGLFRFFSFLPFAAAISESANIVPVTDTSADTILGYTLSVTESSRSFHIFFCILLCTTVILLLFFFFRFLSKKSHFTEKHLHAAETFHTDSVISTTNRVSDSSAVRKIRTQYKELLKWFRRHFGNLEPAHTSLDVHKQISANISQPDTSSQIRDIYLKARYSGDASDEDVRQIKKLCKELKKE